ncbi:MAG: Gfo/Idh/MocA family oxidoreductase [Candidatus Omnitrophica bacterium]|nr:Gfo/Idh/MocA family oxidoreductase [Candidatus Omnitrophota bacterium]MCM8806971.1 Gfo/Idh/MocA family oxidoreductase [Candidatus Omnitrophota bacterium]
MKIKTGVAGLGRSGWNIHCNLISQLPELYEIVAVCDPDEKRIKEAKDKFNCKTYSDYNEFIKDENIELVIVATFSSLHAEHTIKALKSGKNVVCEKPMATNLKDADEMIETSKKTGKLLTVFQNKRYAPDFQKIKEIIDSGLIGKIILVKMLYHSFSRRWDWQTLKKYGGGTLNNTGPHVIDQALQIFGDKEEPEIFCHMEKTLTLGDTEDHVKIILKGKSSPMIDIEITSACCYPQENWLVMGSCGGIKGTFTQLYWKYFDPKDLPPREVDENPTPDRSYNVENIPWKEEEKWEFSEKDKNYPINFYIDLYETLVKGKPLKITPESVRRVMWVIEKCHQIAGI